MMAMVLMVLTTYMQNGAHPVYPGHLSGATHETCHRGRNSVDILQIILGHVDPAGLAIVCRVNKTLFLLARCPLSRHICGRKVHRTLAESTHLPEKSARSIQDSITQI